VRLSLADQDESTRNEFQDRADRIRMELNEKGLNAELYWKNDSPANTVSMVPTSAISGEGIPDLLLWLVRVSLFLLVISCCVHSCCRAH
jgi:translation initiation factor 5B